MLCLKYLKKSNSAMYSILQSEKKTLVNTVSRYYVVVYLQKGGVVPSNHSAGKLHLIKLPMNSEKSIKMRLHQECPTTHTSLGFDFPEISLNFIYVPTP